MDWGGGPGEVCERCGVRKDQLGARLVCNPLPRPVLGAVSEYNPFQ